jgi:putative transposase
VHSQRSWTYLVAHIVWATKNRERLLLPTMDEDLATFFRRKAEALGCTLLAVGFAYDHAHILARYRADCAVSTLVHRLKGASSRERNRGCDPTGPTLFWQDGSWAESCGPQAVPGLVRYIRRQREHHAVEGRAEPWELALFPTW